MPRTSWPLGGPPKKDIDRFRAQAREEKRKRRERTRERNAREKTERAKPPGPMSEKSQAFYDRLFKKD